MSPGSAIRILPAAAINGISCLGVVELATVIVEVLDITKGERSAEIKGLSEPQGVYYSSQER
jgi:hypothetical protein